tara:strand:+ start:280 stop:459 length:180 start_codon:yes stop_codon:yes gene_type:complete
MATLLTIATLTTYHGSTNHFPRRLSRLPEEIGELKLLEDFNLEDNKLTKLVSPTGLQQD